MAQEFQLNAILAKFLDDPQQIGSDFDVASLSQTDLETAVNG
jgi:hypothetical protein